MNAVFRRSRRTQSLLPNYVILVLLAIFSLGPLLILFFNSFKTNEEIGANPLGPPIHGFRISNYSEAWTRGNYAVTMRNSAIVVAGTVAGVCVISGLAAYALARLDFAGKAVILSGALAVAMFPPVSIVGSLFDMWRSVGLYDTWPGLIIPYMTFTLPLAIYTLSAFFREIPWELEQAAQVDGATPFQAFRKVIVPLAAPGIFTASILVFIFAWNDFLFANTLTSTTDAQTVPAALAFFSGGSRFEEPIGAISAAAVVVTVPIIIMVLIFQRRIVAGLTSGAVKG